MDTATQQIEPNSPLPPNHSVSQITCAVANSTRYGGGGSLGIWHREREGRDDLGVMEASKITVPGGIRTKSNLLMERGGMAAGGGWEGDG